MTSKVASWRTKGGSAVAITVLALFASAAPASAVIHHPKGIYAPFADCPLVNPAVELCDVAKTTSGEFHVGNETVPIKNAITLQGGTIENPETGNLTLVAPEDGNTLSKTPQPVPGGLLGLVKCNEISNVIERVACELTFENGVTGVNATTELAAPASQIGLNTSNLILQEGIALSLPVKVHLENPFLGGECYIGSNAHPILIEFTTGTTKPPAPNNPITGKPGELEVKEGGNYLKIANNSLVNNSFAAPEAKGCGGIFSFLIDPIVNGKLGLPSAAGKNTAILDGSLEAATASAVKASE